eukprot:4784532-Prymnesium_polylepis.1
MAVRALAAPWPVRWHRVILSLGRAERAQDRSKGFSIQTSQARRKAVPPGQKAFFGRKPLEATFFGRGNRSK